MKKFDFENKNHHQRLSGDADQVEIDAVRLGSATIDSGIQDELIAGVMDDFINDDGDQMEWAERDMANDSATTGIVGEINRRVQTLGELYPFSVEGNSLRPKDDFDSITYKYCLAISVQTQISKTPFTLLPRTFELVAKDFCAAHFGPYAKSEHTGWPRSRDDQPKIYKDLAECLNKLTKEWIWKPAEGLTNQDSRHIKDNGIDFITWLESPDEEPGKLFILGQCACGEDWTEKYNDIDVKRLTDWFSPLWVEPVKAFCTPYALVQANIWDAGRSAGLVYDRLRITALSGNFEGKLPDSLLQSMRDCVDLVVKQ